MSGFDTLVSEHILAALEHLLNATFLGLFPMLLVGGATSWVAIRIMGGDAGPLDRAAVFAFALIGATVGLMMGASRVPVVNVALPALITLVSTFFAYVYAKEKSSNQVEKAKEIITLATEKGLKGEAQQGQLRDILGEVRFIPFGIAALVIAATTASFYGGSIRGVAEVNARNYEEWLLQYKEIRLPLQRELLRRQAGLTDEGDTSGKSPASSD